MEDIASQLGRIDILWDESGIRAMHVEERALTRGCNGHHIRKRGRHARHAFHVRDVKPAFAHEIAHKVACIIIADLSECRDLHGGIERLQVDTTVRNRTTRRPFYGSDRNQHALFRPCGDCFHVVNDDVSCKRYLLCHFSHQPLTSPQKARLRSVQG